MQHLFLLFFIFIVAAYWVDTVRVKELARRAGHRFCDKHDVQFLDSTVIKQKTRLIKSRISLVQLQRTYFFEYSIRGDERHNGIIIYNGHYLLEIQLDLNTFDNDKSQSSSNNDL